MLTRAQMNVNSSWSVARVYSGGSGGLLRTTCRVYSGMSTDLSARSRVEAMLDKWEAAERGPGQAPPPALGRRRQQQGGTRGRSAHLKRSPPGGRRQHYGGRAAAAAPYSLESDLPSVQRFAFVPSLGISASALGRRPPQQHRCCQKCLPISRAGYSEQPSSSASGVKDLLVMEPRSKSLLARLFPSVAYMCEREMDYPLTGYEVVDRVLHSDRVSNGVKASTAAEVQGMGRDDVATAKVKDEQEARAGQIIKTMAAIIYKRLIRTAGVVLVHLFRRLFQGFHVHLGQMGMVKEVAKKGYPLAFLPTHKSHLDYLLMTFALACMDVKVPHIAAGENLNIPVFSWLQRHLGGFFIKRRLDNGNGKDVLYRAVLQEYMEQLLKDGQYIEFFVEGSRSRTGKPIHPKGGLLSMLVDSVMEGTIPDIYIVPVDVSYDKIFEGGLRCELMGQPKVQESLWQALCSIWRMFTTRLGLVRLNISQPFSLREYITSHVIFDAPWQGPERQKAYNKEEGRKRKLVSALAHHVVHDFQCSASAMPTSMVAFLLLTKHRKGVTRSTLISSYNWLAMELKARNRSLAFCGPASCAVAHAEKYLQDEVIRCAPDIGSGPNKEVFYPNLVPTNILGLVHHKNQIISTFLMESVVACSMQALLTNQGEKMEEAPIISREEVVEAAVYLCGILSREFIYTEPCVHIEGAINDAVDALTSRGVLGSRGEGSLSARETNIRQALSQQCSWNDDEDLTDEPSEHWLQVNASAESLEHLSFLQTILEPFLESYWLAAYFLLTMEGQHNEADLVKAIHSRAMERIQTGTASYGRQCTHHLPAETVSIDPLRSAVLRFKDMGIIFETSEAGVAVADSGRLQELTMDLVEFCR